VSEIIRLKFLLIIILITYNYCNAQSLYDFELNSVIFKGNKSFSDNDLRKVIYSEETPIWLYKFVNSFTSFGKPPVFFDSLNIRVDLNSLRTFYHAKGFFKSKFSYGYEYDTTSKYVNLYYFIEEGEPATFGKLNVYGFDKLEEGLYYNILNRLAVDTTIRFDQDILAQKINSTIYHLSTTGYFVAKFDSSEIVKDTAMNSTNISLYFDPGKKYLISGLSISKEGKGSDNVEESLLEKLVAIKAGEVYDSYEIRQSRNRLFRSGLFNSLIFDASIKDTTGNEVPLRLLGNIGSMNEFSPDIKMNNKLNLFNAGIGATYVRKNFFGGARKLRFSAEAELLDVLHFNFGNLFKSRDERDSTYQVAGKMVLGLEQPYLFNKPIFGKIDAYYQYEILQPQEVNTVGIITSMDFELPRYTLINLLKPYYSFDRTSIELDQIITNNIEIENFLVDLNIVALTSAIGTELGSSNIDDIMYPTSGYNTIATIEGAVSYNYFDIRVFRENQLREEYSTEGRGYFYKLLSSNSYYKSLNKERDMILAMKLKSGYIYPFSGGIEMIPANRTFYVGGSNSVRGWKARELKATTQFESIDLTDSIRGGTFVLEGSYEFRKRFWGVLGGNLFIDFGNTWDSYNKFRWDQIAVATGFGIRYYSPIAPFRIDFGFKFYDPNDKQLLFKKNIWDNFSFHFGIGEAF
jgi:outer membrane protein insertion porin family